MPAASRTCFGTAAVINDDDDDGPALELLGLVCMTISEMLLRIGMAAVSNDPSDPKNDIHDAAYDMIAESGDCRPDLRASSHARELRRDVSVGWTRYVDGPQLLYKRWPGNASLGAHWRKNGTVGVRNRFVTLWY